MGRQIERPAVLIEGVVEFAAPLVDVGQSLDGRKILGSLSQHARQLVLRAVQVPAVDQGSAQRDVGGKVTRVVGQPGATRVDGFLRTTGPAQRFGQLRKRDRQGVLLDPTPKLLDS